MIGGQSATSHSLPSHLDESRCSSLRLSAISDRKKYNTPFSSIWPRTARRPCQSGRRFHRPPSESGPQAKKRAFSWPKADPVVFNDILEGQRAVVAKVELSQSLKNLLKAFLYREYRMSEEVSALPLHVDILEGFDVDKETLEGLSICEAFDEVFKTDSFDFEPNEPLIYAMTVRAVLDIEKLDRDVIRKEPQGFRLSSPGSKVCLIASTTSTMAITAT